MSRAMGGGAGLSRSKYVLAGSIAAGFVGQAALVVSGVLAARILGVEDRGYFALLVLIPAVISYGSLGLQLAATYEIASDQRSARAVVRTLIRPVLAQAAILLVVHAGVLVLVFHDDPDRVRRAVVLSLAGVPSLFAQYYGLSILQGRNRFKEYNILRTLPGIAYAVGLTALWFVGGATLRQVTLVWAISSLLTGVITMTFALRGLPQAETASSGVRLSKLLRFGLKGLIGSTSPIETFRLDQAVIGLFLSPAVLGLYVVAVAFTNLPRFVAQSIGVVAYPQIAARSNEREARAALWPFLWLTVAASSLIVVVLEFTASPLVSFFFGRHFSGAVTLTRILLVGSLFYSVRRVLTEGAQGLGRPGLGTLAEIASWGVLLPAMAILTPLLGARGMALALTISAGLSLVVLVLLITSRTPGRFRRVARSIQIRGAGP